MKKAILFFLFTFALGAFAASAQCSGAAKAGKSCCASKIAKAAAADPSIEKRTSDEGTVAYVRKEADAQGNVKFVSLQFDEESNAFVNAAPKMAASDKEGMTKKSAACGSSSAKKACCAGKAGKSCHGEKAEQ